MRRSTLTTITARYISVALVIAMLAICSSLLITTFAQEEGLTVTINQGEEQPDPTDTSPIVFTVLFSAPVTGFETGDVTLSGTAGATTATVSDSGDSTYFTVLVSGMTANGTVIANVPAGVAIDGSNKSNQASTSIDNVVTFFGLVVSNNFYVSKTADTNDGSCDIDDCSLREAIVASNTNLGFDTIRFNIPTSDPGRNATTGVFTIILNSALGALPQITDAVTIDGYSQGTVRTPIDLSDDARANTQALAAGLNTRLLIELTDDASGVEGNGLDFSTRATDSRVRGLSIYGFSLGAGIRVADTAGVRVEGNFLGIRADGSSAVGNIYGVSVGNSSRTAIGGPTADTINLISGNRQAGVVFTNTIASTEDRNVVLNNLIGTNSAGALGLPNAHSAVGIHKGGVLIINSGGVALGAAGVGNVISGNNGIGVMISDTGSAASIDNLVQANLIGTTANGAAPLPNNGDGIEISGAQNNTIGGLDAGDGNVIRSNAANGIEITGSQINGTNSNSAKATAITELVALQSNDNTIAGNTITSNGMDGVLVVSGIGNRITGNSIYSNTQQGIDLLGDGVTANDANDADPTTGPNANNLQNYPVISSAIANSLGTTIGGTLDGGVPGTTYLIELFSNAECDGTHGEGQTLIASIASGPSNANGDVSFSFQTKAVLFGQVITATATDTTTDDATDTDNDTSEFSACVVVTGDILLPSVTINQAVGQADPTTSTPINFTVVFSESVTGFQTGDVTLGGTAGATTAIVTGNATTYNVSVSGMTQSGTVIGTIGANVAIDAAGNPNTASTSTDNTVTFHVPGQIQFKFSTFQANESGPVANILVTRTNGSGGSVSATFNTSNGSATAGADYTAVNNFTVTFENGDTADKTVTVPLLDDTAQEPSETVNLSLTNPTGGASLGSPNTATLTIVDNDLPTVEFANSSHNVTEDCTFVTISVTRGGDPAAPFTVRYATNSIQASERSDYTTAIGTLRFAAGETTASFDLLITEDSLTENTETLSINLTNPTGGVQLGAASTAIVAINDDGDGISAQNAIDDPRTFVCQHYHDFLARQSDAAGETFWTNDITSCGTDQSCRAQKRANVSAAFFLSIEFQRTGYFILRTYKTAFGRQPDNPRYNAFIEDLQEINHGVIVGTADWQARLEANQQAYVLAFVSRSAFVASYPLGQTAAQYVDALFQSAGVTPSAAERNAAISAFGSGGASGRANALRSIVESDSIYNGLYNPAFVVMEYFGYLRRNPNDAPDNDFAGYNFWLAKLDSFSLPGENMRDEVVVIRRLRRAQMVEAFITSVEYRQRFGNP